MRRRINFDLRGQIGLFKRVFKYGLVVGATHIIVLRNRDQELRLRFRRLKVRTVRSIRDEIASVERSDCSDAIGHCSRRP